MRLSASEKQDPAGEEVMSMTNGLARMDDEVRWAYGGECWHGPPPCEILRDVTAATAAARHPQLAHSIWSLANHVAALVEVLSLRMVEWQAIELPNADDFPAVTDAGDAASVAALADLDRRHGELRRVGGGLQASRLDEIIPGKGYPVAVMLHETAQHYAYHAGRIALLKKLVS
jgi:hypothetical protein